jgi:hypothetical protein
MARPTDIQDADLRALVTAARSAYMEGNYRDSVQRSTDAFLELLRRQPDFLTKGPFAGNTRRVWPQLGVALKTSDGVPPQVVFERDQFTRSEAITYYEYASDSIVAAKL